MSVQSKGSVLARLFPGLFDAIAANVSQDQMNQMEEQAAVLEAQMSAPTPAGQTGTAPTAAAAQPEAAAAAPAETPAPAPQAAVEKPQTAPGVMTQEDVVASFNAMKAMMESFMKAQTPPAAPAAAPAPVQGSAVVPVAGDVSNGPTQGNAEGENEWYNDLKRLKAQYNKYGLTDHINV